MVVFALEVETLAMSYLREGNFKVMRGGLKLNNKIFIYATQNSREKTASSEMMPKTRYMRMNGGKAINYGKLVLPIRYLSHSLAALLPSFIAQTTRL